MKQPLSESLLLKLVWFDFCLRVGCVGGLSLAPEVASEYDLCPPELWENLAELWFCMPLETRLDVLSKLLLCVFSTLLVIGIRLPLWVTVFASSHSLGKGEDLDQFIERGR